MNLYRVIDDTIERKRERERERERDLCIREILEFRETERKGLDRTGMDVGARGREGGKKLISSLFRIRRIVKRGMFLAL